MPSLYSTSLSLPMFCRLEKKVVKFHGFCFRVRKEFFQLAPNPDGVLDSANCWHYRSVSLGEAFGGSLTPDSAKKLALFRCKSGYRDFLCMLKLVVSKGRYEWAVRNIEEKTYFLGKIHYYFIFYSLALVLALHTYDCHLIKQSQKSYALKNFHLLRLRNNYINHKNLK